MVEVLFLLADLEPDATGRGLGLAGFHLLLEEHVHEHVHGLGLDDQRAGGALGVGVEVLVHAVVVHDRDVAGLPVVALAVVDLVAVAVEDVERGLVDVAVLLRLPAGAVLLQVEVEGLGDAVLRLHVVAAVGLRPVDELDLVRLPDAGHRPQPFELRRQAVVTLDTADERAVLVAVVRHASLLPIGLTIAP
ncbi:hypothetical protein BJF90_38370 [Pseudonocardia sp. CNS-004]|nr:hypothetical protein BJF90_38370 [Pseudonocardia sp. CNS-004]